MLGFYLQGFRDDGKAEFVLRQFRRIYPNSYGLLVSDAGDDLSGVAKRRGADYLHADSNTGVSPAGFTKAQTKTWLRRFHLAMEGCPHEFLIYLEDDVLVRAPVKVNPDWKIAGVWENPIPRPLMWRYGSSFNTALYGACGGTLYHVETFLKLYPKIMEFMDTRYEEATAQNVAFGFLDMFMPFFYMLNGYEYSFNSEMTESHRNPMWRESSHPIVHGKAIYNG